ncbi:hypothetical protein FXO38_34985 [Capsicum annuum]|nr:hypothetical protein FXO38_34985 [Capsicum annuum]KAF3622366.1 hypothetical protein FXO37_32370 [Capsicum annuum]
MAGCTVVAVITYCCKFHHSGLKLVKLCEDKFSPKFYHRNELALSIGMKKSSENIYGTVLSMIMKLSDMNCVATGYDESETVDPSMKMGNMLPGSERSAEISQFVDNQNYEGGTFEDSNLTTKNMETRSPFKERKDDESMDLGPSTMSNKGIMLEEQSVESYVNCYS